MKKLLLLLLCVPLIGLGQSFEPTYCECAKAFITSMKVSGLKNLEDISDPKKVKTLKKIEKKYQNCEKLYGKTLLNKSEDSPIFQEEFLDCILDDKQYTDFCKCTYMIQPAFLEALSMGFDEDIDKEYKRKRERFWENKMSCCNPTIQKYGKLDEWGEDLAEDREECKKRLLNEVLGQLVETEYHKEYDSYGQLYEGNLKNGKQDGVWKLYYENGQVKQEQNFKDGEADGLWKDFYENGKLMREANYKNGEDNGLHRSWLENGKLNSEENYKDDLFDGLQKYYYPNGRLQIEQNWEDGIYINSKCWDEESNKIDCE
jgi:antitoxin component YwqK of YwqJK toxin-antitoxin module